MSLISVRNFVAPLQNRLHLGTIIMVAVLIAVARLSGGAVRVGHSQKKSSLEPAVTAQDNSVEEDSLETIETQPQKKLPARDLDRDPLDDLLAEKPLAHTEQPAKNPNNNKPNQLSDIRKSLGLE